MRTIPVRFVPLIGEGPVLVTDPRPLGSAAVEAGEVVVTPPPRARRGALRTRSGSRTTGSSSGKFCAVGATGYVLNLGRLLAADRRGRPLPARRDLFLPRRGDEQLHMEPAVDVQGSARPRRGAEGKRSSSSRCSRSGANLLCLHLLIGLGLGKLVAQAIAIVLVTPVNFIGNKLWSFRVRRS